MIRHVEAAKICKIAYIKYQESNPKELKRTMVVKSKKELYISVKGSTDLSDWKQNFYCIQNEEGIHKGFHDYATSCLNELIDDNVINLMKRARHITLCSHSLGGTASIIIMSMLLSNYEFIKKQNIDLVLFGAPKPGGTKFMHRFNDLLREYPNVKVYRYVNEFDYISKFPPLAGYEHVCEEISLNSFTEYHAFDILSNHAIQSYVDNLELERTKRP